ncbi:MAG: YdcF family protein [Clostridia bacterium]|nr:YdcF family protein [Clostridia bacterium]
MKINKKIRIILISLISFFGLCFLAVAGINIYIIEYAKPYIVSVDEAKKLDKDCVIALGAQVFADGTPCDQLYDRVSYASEVILGSESGKLLLSGDSHNSTNYDEIQAMKNVAYEKGVNSGSIVSDPYGLNTFQSMQRMKDEFGFDSAVIVTQEYHIYRSVFLARKLGIDAYGVASDPRNYATIVYNEAREVLARVKAFYLTINL